MKKLLLITILLGLKLSAKAQTSQDSLFIRKIFDQALTDSRCYPVLQHLCKNIGPRLSGSRGAADAVKFMQDVMQEEQFSKVFLQECMVPHWVRGSICKLQETSSKRNLKACALGGSDGGKVEAEVIEVQRIEDLDLLGKEKIAGKIVYFSRPMEPRHIHTFEAYGGCVDQRWAGPSKAAKYGAVATMVRSMNLREDGYPHTGSMAYDSLYPRIPAVAISTEDATWLSAQIKKNVKLKFQLETNCQTLPDTLSHNVIGEMKGSEKPNEFIIVGGHLDAWDNGEGAHDDGAGCVQSFEALRILQKLGYKPKNSIRAVMFMNEENGLRGGKRYAELADSLKEKHLFAIESDRGGFTPRGFYTDSDDPAVVASVGSYRALLEPYGIHDFKKGGGGADINPLKKQGTICIGFVPDSQRYFDHHHAEYDSFEHVNKRELELGAAAMAALIYLLDQR
jgi:carboxypeptidase Q